MDTTLSLPFIKTKDNSLFHEHLKRLCCVRARERGINLFTISKSHGMPSIELIEALAKEALGLPDGKVAEHWFLRLPVEGIDDWSIEGVVEGRQIPPIGAMTYLFRLHKNTPVMRLDMDRVWWEERFKDKSAAELKIFEELDYSGHDQRAYGYPFPIKACHDRTRLSMAERTVLKKQIIDAAVSKGMKRSLFRDASAATGHS
jgi:NurA-like 5'-3' nuclease